MCANQNNELINPQITNTSNTNEYIIDEKVYNNLTTSARTNNPAPQNMNNLSRGLEQTKAVSTISFDPVTRGFLSYLFNDDR